MRNDILGFSIGVLLSWVMIAGEFLAVR